MLHHLVHEGGWTLQLHPGRGITLHRPDGTVSHDGTTTNRITTACQRTRPPPTTAAEIAEALQLALHDIQVNAP